MPEIRLRESDQASIRQLLQAEFESDESLLPRAVVLAVARLIPCDAIGVCELDPAGYLVSAMAVPAGAAVDVGLQVCDVPVPTALQHDTAASPCNAGTMFNPNQGVVDRLRVGFRLAAGRNVIQLCLDRRTSMFSERDVAMLALLQPALERIVLTQPRSSPSPSPCLSDAERRVLELVAEGGSNQEVATRLCVTVATVRKHLEHAYIKLGVKNRTAAVAALVDKPGEPPGR